MHPDQFADLWPADGKPLGTIVLIHGGYWRQRYDLTGLEPLAHHLSELGWTVLNIEYRRINGQPDVWTEMSADVLAAAELARARPVVAVGHSAGGHLALWLAAQPGAVDAAVALAPLADLRSADRLRLSNHAVAELLGAGSDEVPERYDDASPIENLPLGVPQLVLHGALDDSVPQQMSVDYAAAASEAGDDIELLAPDDVDHMQIIDPADDTWRDIERRLQRWAEELP